ncbi:MAG: response regulator [Solirubrobacteraceae bacterium]|jgi:CheY-like chemotaxis protein
MALTVASPTPAEGASGTNAMEGAILVVDDNAAKRLAIRAILQPLGHTIFEADSGREALRAVMARTFAVILMDVKMPTMDGYETAKLIRTRADCEHTPIIFITAYSRDEAQIPLAYATGAVDFIFAPLTPEVLRAKVRVFADLYRQARELELAHETALAASRAKSAFVANLSHEIRTPLNGMLGMGSLLRDTTLDATQKRYVEALTASGDALLAVIGDVLDFSKIEAGSLELDCTDFDPRDLIYETCQILADRAHTKGLELSYCVAGNVPAQLNGDRARLRQILLNLISNSIKFTTSGEISVRLARDSAASFRFAVRDTGRGIDPERADALFEPFVQADQTTTREYGGTGLGLTIARQLVGLMGGAIGAEPGEASGSHFWFTALLPEVADPTQARDQDELGGLRALLIEDNLTSAAGIESYLDGWNIAHERVADADGAFDAIEGAAQSERPFDLVLLDVNVPLMSGLHFLAAMRRRPVLHRSKLVILSSVPLGKELGDSSNAVVLMKPFRQSALRHAIAELLAAGSTDLQPEPLIDAEAKVGWADLGLVVLAVDDDAINRMVLCEMLAALGVHSDIAENGREAIDMAARTDYAAIFMDCQMPVIDGFEATTKIRGAEGARRVPIIAVTALTMPQDKQRCLECGMDDYLSKPIGIGELTSMAMRWFPAEPAPPQPAALDVVRAPG